MGCMSWNGEKKHLLRFSSAHQIKLVSSKKDTLRFTRETSMSFISELAQPTGTLGLVGFKNKLQVNNAHYHVHGCNRVPSSIINTRGGCDMMIIGLVKADQATSNRAVIIFIWVYKIIIMSHPPDWPQF